MELVLVIGAISLAGDAARATRLVIGFVARQRARYEARVRRILQDDSVRRFIKHSSWMVGSQLASALLGLLQVALLSRVLGKDGYGTLVLITTAAMTVRQLLSVRVWEWTTRDLTYALEHKDAAGAAFVLKCGLWTSGVVNLLSLALVAALSPFVEEHFLKGQAAAWLVIAFGATFVGSWTYETCFSALRAAQMFRYLAVQGIVVALTRLIVLGATALATRRLEMIVVAYIVFELVAGSWLLVKTSQVFKDIFGASFWRLKTPPIIAALRQNKRLLLFGSLLDTMKLATTRADVLVLGYLATPASVAVYQAAYNFIDGIIRLASPVALVTLSDLARSAARGDGSGMLRTIRRMSLMGLAVGGVIALALFSGSTLLVWLVYGERYGESASILRILSVSPLWLAVLWMQPAFASAGRPEWGVKVVGWAIATKVVLLVLLVLFMPGLPERALAIANAIYFLVPVVVSPWYAARLKRLVSAPSFKERASVWGSAVPAPRG